MSESTDTISQLDLMGYADGRLDPVRRDAVERVLARRPDLLATAQAIAEQNEAIQQAYLGVVEEPLPPHLRSVLDRADANRRRARLARVAAVAALALATGAAGWWGGQMLDTSDADDVAAFVEAAAKTHSVATDPHSRQLSAWPASALRPLEWLAERVTLELRAPRLGHGYRPADNALVEIDGRPTVKLTFERDDGETVSLFLRTRWRETPPSLNLDTASEPASVYWFDGPLMWVLTGNLGAEELRELADVIHGTTRLRPGPSPSAQTPVQNVLDLETSPNATARPN